MNDVSSEAGVETATEVVGQGTLAETEAITSDDTGSKDANIDEGTAAESTTETEGKPSTTDEKPAQDKGSADEELRAELVKRYGDGKTDQEYAQELFKSYREIETKMSGKDFKELQETVDAFGGVDVLKKALADPSSNQANAGQTNQGQPRLDPGIQALIDSGELDPENAKDRLTIDLATTVIKQQAYLSNKDYDQRKESFETRLDKEIAPKYPDADIKAVKAVAFAGLFDNLTGDAFWRAIDSYAEQSHNEVTGKVENRVKSKMEELKKLNNTSTRTGTQSQTRSGQKTALQAFNDAWDRGGLN